MGQRIVWVFALAAVGFIGLAVTGTLPLPAPAPAGATQYCTQYQYNTCGPQVPPLIAFESNRDGAGNFEIYVMNADGSTQTRVFANNNRNDEEPSWSPDGGKIAFKSDRDGNTEIYVMNVDGSAQTRLTSNAAADNGPSWSPDGTRIAFGSNRNGNDEIYVMSIDGSGQTRLTSNAASDFQPSWSPDGTKIAFASSRDGNFEIYVMNANGSGQTRLTSNAALDFEPSWSPDGTKIAFASFRDGNGEIYVMGAEGSAQTRLTTNAAADFWPAWSPDGTKIAFTSDRDSNNNEIYVMNANGSGQTRLTNSAGADGLPSWQRTPPAAPSSLIATALSRSQIGLAWTDNATNETRFRIERSPNGSDWHQLGAVAAGVTTYTHARQRALTTSYYRVHATNGAGNSAYSNVASATTLGSILTTPDETAPATTGAGVRTGGSSDTSTGCSPAARGSRSSNRLDCPHAALLRAR